MIASTSTGLPLNLAPAAPVAVEGEDPVALEGEDPVVLEGEDPALFVLELQAVSTLTKAKAPMTPAESRRYFI
jgi:hypothetical protein